jgi:hypothetical protein
LKAQQDKSSETHKKHFEVHIDASFIVPIPIGDNFANNGLNFQYGLGTDLRYYFKNNLFFGLGYQFLHADNVNSNLLGFYDDTNINSYFIGSGYRFYLNNRLRFEPYLALGLTFYNNKRNEEQLSIINFRDTAASIVISPSFKYILNNNFMFYVKPEYRIDNMSIRVDPILEDVFKRATYITLAFGFTVYFY